MEEKRLDYASISPQGLQAFRGVRNYIAGCGLDPILVDLVYLRVSQINGCAYCVDLHYRDALKRGVNPRKLNSLVAWREGPFFNARERAALAWTESLTFIARTGAPQEDFDAVKAHFSEKELADLSYAIALMNALNRVSVGFRGQPELSAEERAAIG
ncbi:MAG: carboxymuconolactone decarboxylase family protein [Pseudorhodoplanes sp.]